MSTKNLKLLVFISMCAFVFLISGVLLTRTHITASEAPTLYEDIHPSRQKRATAPRLLSRHTRAPDTLTAFQTSDFYKTIIENNLFRPLGWTPPRPREPYRLIGTILPRSAKTPPTAILEHTPTRRTESVTIGDKLDEATTLIDIEPKRVTLENAGVQRTLRLNTTPLLK